MKYTGILMLALNLIAFPSISQTNTYREIPEDTIFLNFRSISFIKNNEYSNPVIEGYTLIGYFIQPVLVYRPAEKIILNLGTHLLSYSGTGKFTSIRPVYSVTWSFSEKSFFTIGSLSGSDTHQMFDPHFNKERLYNAYLEDGLQFRTSGKNFFNDTWLSWENFIFKNDTEREVFTAGESFRYISPVIADLFWFEFPLQIQFKHYGGQISNYNENVETYFNLSSGAAAYMNLIEQRHSYAGLECLYFSGSSLTHNAPSGIDNGYANWYRLSFTDRIGKAELGFWKSHDYFAPNGNFIFSSVSDHIDHHVISDRKLITGSVSMRLIYKNLFEFYMGFDGYYDTELKRFDNSLTLHMRLDKLFRLFSPK